MTTSPFAQAQMSIDGGAAVMGGVTIDGLGHTVQLSGVSTTAWDNNLWAIYEYPVGFALPTGWTNVNGIYTSSDVVPSLITIPPATTLWGKYFFRLIANQGLLNGVYMGPGSPQPLVDVSSAIRVFSPSGQIDMGFGETNQFDALRQWIGEYKANLRVLESKIALSGPITTVDATPVFIPLATLALNDAREIDVLVKIYKPGGGIRQSFKLSGLFYGAAGPTATLDGGSLTDASPRGTGTAVASFDLSGAVVRLKIVGIAATTLTTTYDVSVV